MTKQTRTQKSPSTKGAKPRILVIHGPNLNLLGSREPEIYGEFPLADINTMLQGIGEKAGYPVDCFQSNHEGDLVDRIQAAPAEGAVFAIINPGAYTHTSIALRDALTGVKLPFIEVHLSNIHAREEFRQHSYFSDIAVGVICGLGAYGYLYALESVLLKLSARS